MTANMKKLPLVLLLAIWYDDGGSDDKDAIKYDGDDVNINKDEEDNDGSVTDNDANESNDDDDDDDSVRDEDDSAVGDDNKNSAPVDEFDDDGEDKHVAAGAVADNEYDDNEIWREVVNNIDLDDLVESDSSSNAVDGIWTAVILLLDTLEFLTEIWRAMFPVLCFKWLELLVDTMSCGAVLCVMVTLLGEIVRVFKKDSIPRHSR